jgi:hypothetical protein
MVISCSVYLGMRNIADKICREKRRTVFCSIKFPKIELFWDYVEKCGTAREAIADSIIRRMRFACCIINATDTPSEHVIIIGFSRQQWVCECASILPYSTLPTLLYFELFQTSLNKVHKLRSHMTVEIKRATSLYNINNIDNILSAFKSMAVVQL